MAEEILVVDETKILAKILDLPNQLEKAWTTHWIKNIDLNAEKIDRVLIAGMGGSGIAGALAQDLLSDSLLPISTWSDYGLPGWVNDKTLFVASSYSGNTEETLDATKAALEKKAQVVTITHGGKLKELSAIHGLPLLEVSYDSQPRSAIGWLYGTLLALLAKLKISTVSEKTYFEALAELKAAIEQKKFPAKAEELAVTLANKIPLVMTAAPLGSVARRWVTQFNENSKTFAVAAQLPELSHNFITGLDNAVLEKLTVLFLESAYSFSRNGLREKIVQKILVGKEIPFTPLSVRANSLLSEQWLFIHFGDLLSYYLAGVYGVDPANIEPIEYLKTELTKA